MLLLYYAFSRKSIGILHKPNAFFLCIMPNHSWPKCSSFLAFVAGPIAAGPIQLARGPFAAGRPFAAGPRGRVVGRGWVGRGPRADVENFQHFQHYQHFQQLQHFQHVETVETVETVEFVENYQHFQHFQQFQQKVFNTFNTFNFQQVFNKFSTKFSTLSTS